MSEDFELHKDLRVRRERYFICPFCGQQMLEKARPFGLPADAIGFVQGGFQPRGQKLELLIDCIQCERRYKIISTVEVIEDISPMPLKDRKEQERKPQPEEIRKRKEELGSDDSDVS